VRGATLFKGVPPQKARGHARQRQFFLDSPVWPFKIKAGAKPERSEEIKSRWWLWLVVALFCAGIFYLSSLSNLKTPYRIHLDKLVHIIEYGILGFLVLVALVRTTRLSLSKAVIIAFLFSLLYGAGDEWHQRFVAGRQASLMDVAADGLGGLLGGLAALARVTYVRNRDRQG
jgi:VanZ family protein